MKTNELRIGNYVLNGAYGEYRIIEGYDIDHAQFFEPILLTEEWLLKFGFEFKPTGVEVWNQVWEYNEFSIWHWNLTFFHNYHFGGEIQFVHQLQNLYFDIMGQELTLNEN